MKIRDVRTHVLRYDLAESEVFGSSNLRGRGNQPPVPVFRGAAPFLAGGSGLWPRRVERPLDGSWLIAPILTAPGWTPSTV